MQISTYYQNETQKIINTRKNVLMCYKENSTASNNGN